MDFFFKHVSDQYDVKMDIYNLNEEIEYCLDGLTATINDDKLFRVDLYRGKLPKSVIGDVNRFRMCFRTLLDFGTKYSTNNQMQVRCEVDQMKEMNKKQMFII